jgi:hypothetical protein
MTVVSDLIGRNAPASEVIAAAGLTTVFARTLAEAVGDDFRQFWTRCPDAGILALISYEAGAPFDLRASGIDSLVNSTAQLCGGQVAGAIRDRLLAEATALRASPGPTSKGMTRHDRDWGVASSQGMAYRAALSAAWLAKASALSSCTCGEDHFWQAEKCLANATDEAMEALFAWAAGLEGFATPHDESEREKAEREYAVGQFACDFIRQSLDLDLLGLGAWVVGGAS